MKLLIVGLGYAGTRFLRAFQSVWLASNAIPGQVAFVGRTKHRDDMPYFADLTTAVANFQPDIVIMSVNDVYRTEVMVGLKGYRGFIICEKPFVCPWDDLAQAERCCAEASGFCLDLVERYSPITDRLQRFVRDNALELLRATFTWGKDRLGDHRPTCGVTSEIIHALDIIQHVCELPIDYTIEAAHGVCSDFSVSGPRVPDSVSLLARLGDVPVLGYASFVNVSRRREIGFIFARRTGGLVFANMLFDDPAWDDDRLRIWEMAGPEEAVLIEEHVTPAKSASGDFGIEKLIRLACDVSDFVLSGTAPLKPFADLTVAVRLQRTLNIIHEAVANGPTMSFSRYGAVPITTNSGSWERLG